MGVLLLVEVNRSTCVKAHKTGLKESILLHFSFKNVFNGVSDQGILNLTDFESRVIPAGQLGVGAPGDLRNGTLSPRRGCLREQGGHGEDLGLTGKRGALLEGFELGVKPCDLTVKGALNRP